MKFKKIFMLFGLTSVLAFSACKKVIEIEPEFSKDGSQIFNTVQDYEFALTGAYALFRQVGYMGSGGQTTSTWATLPDMMSDNLVQTTADLGNWTAQVNWTYDASDADISVAWISAYSVVAQANLVLRNLEQFSATNPKAVNRIKGQALAIRAVTHFDVLRYWGVEYDRNSSALGIPYVTLVDIEFKPKRLTVKESWDAIFKDMLEAETLLGDIDKNLNTANNKAFLDRNAVRALLSRMYLYAKVYDKAEEYATLVINAVPLASRTNFPNIWLDVSKAEVLWSVAFANASEGSPSSGLHLGSSNRNRFRPPTAILNSYDQANDVRFASYFASRATGGTAPLLPFATSTRKIVSKFLTRATTGLSTTLDNVVDWKVIRTGELYLIRAEARAMQGGAKAVLGLQDLNDLRAARITGYVPVALTGTALFDAIQAERRRELLGEGHRWFDLKRTTRTINRAEVDAAGARANLEPSNRAWTWPIPQGEIDANPNMAGQQTPGY